MKLIVAILVVLAIRRRLTLVSMLALSSTFGAVGVNF